MKKEENNRSMFNEVALLEGIYLYPATAFDLFRELGAAIDALDVYQSVCTRPDKLLAQESKRGLAIKHGKRVIGILSSLQKQLGKRILLRYVSEDEDIIELVQDLDDYLENLHTTPGDGLE